MIELVVLDIAGTTIEEGNVVYDVLRRVVEDQGAQVEPEDFIQWTGTEKRWAIENLLRIGGVEPTATLVDSTHARFVELLDQAYREQPPAPVQGVDQTLRSLRERGIKVALTTGFSRRTTLPLLQAAGWALTEDDEQGVLDALVCAPEVSRGRPAPYMIHRAMEATGVEDVRVVAAAGDTPADVLAARRAGVLSVGVLTGIGSRADFDDDVTDMVLDSVNDLLDDPRFAAR